MQSKKTIEKRVRQLLALDKNAGDIYRSLADMTEDKELRDKINCIANDEDRHMDLSLQMLSRLNNDPYKS